MAGMTVLIVDDDNALREGLAETAADLGYEPKVATSGAAGLAQLRTQVIDAVLLDLRLGGSLDGLGVLKAIQALETPPPVAILTAYATADNTIDAMRLGAFDHLTKPIGRAELADLLKRMTALRGRDISHAATPADNPTSPLTLVGSSDEIRKVQKTIGLAADSNSTVLVLGETGTGKELVARALHEHGKRQGGPFAAVNCAAIPADLLESELFGHIKGAFTGASADRAGAFREAHGGTLFLDEIGDMPPAMQAKILRVLQDKIVTPIGGKATRVDVRVVAATHRNLPALIKQGLFREDLFYRLNVVSIALPPLRERLADIIPLAEHFLRLAAGDNAGSPRRMTARLAAQLLRYGWPGNVRELKNVIDRASILVRGDVIDVGDVDFAISPAENGSAGDANLWLSEDLPTAVAKLEAEMIRRALMACGGNRTEAARRLNINRQLFYTKAQRYGLIDSVSEITTDPVRKSDDF